MIRSRLGLMALVVLSCLGECRAAMFNGTLYYTRFAGGPNVNSVDYSYNDVTHA